MKRIVPVLAAALALPSAAQAKEITGLTLCGPDGCKSAKLTGFGHREPMSPAGGNDAPAPGSFYRLSFGVDGHEDAWSGLYYEPRSGLAAFPSVTAGWHRLDPALAALAKELAARVVSFPGPVVTEVRIGRRVVREDAASYLALYGLEGERAVPGEGEAVSIRFFGATVEDPWTASSLLYYPDDGIVQTGTGTFVRLSADLAADVEAARPLGAGEPTMIPWIALGFGVAGSLVLLALWAGRRGAPSPERPARPPIPSA